MTSSAPATGAEARPMRARAARIALAVAPLFVAEGVARAIPEPTPTPVQAAPDEIVLKGNPYLLWELSPGTHEELGVTVHVNAQGFRGPELGPKRAARLLTLGDSSVYGFGVEEPQTWSSVTAAALDVEAVNGAVPGWSSYQALNMLALRGLSVEPDLLVVGTLWSDNNFDGFTDAELLASHRLWDQGWTRGARALLDASALFRQLDWHLRVAPQGARARNVGWDLGNGEPRTGRRRVSIDAYGRNLDAVARMAHERGAGVLFLMLANQDDLRSRVAEPAWAPYRRVMRDAAARWGAPLVDVPAVFAASGRSADALFLDRMHPSAIGHAIIGNAVADQLRSAGWPRTPLRLEAPADPPPAYVDPFEGRGGLPTTGRSTVTGTVEPAGGGAASDTRAELRVRVRLPEGGGPDAALVVLAADGQVMGRAVFRRGESPVLSVPSRVREVRLQVRHDADDDGLDADDPSYEQGPLSLPADGRPLELDVSRR